MRLLLACLLLSSCGFPDPRDPQLSPDTLAAIKLKASETAQWAPWCDGYPSAQECNDGDGMAGAIGFGCSVGFKPACDAVSASVKDGQLHRSPNRQDSDNTASRDQLFGFLAAQLAGENHWIDVKRFIKANGKICKDATDSRCELTPTVWALLGGVHSHLGYVRDPSMFINSLIWDRVLLAQANTVPSGYQLNLVAEAAWLAYKLGMETELTYVSAVMALSRQPVNPWFCTVVFGPDDKCANLMLEMWPEEPEHKEQWSIARDIFDDDWKRSQGWEWLFLSGLFGVDLNQLDYHGKRYSKDSLPTQPTE